MRDKKRLRQARPKVRVKSQWYLKLLNYLKNDPYYWLLTISWTKLLGLISLLYLAANFFFAFTYMTAEDGIANADPASFSDAFFFSIQTMSTVGYGNMYPQTFYAQVLVTVEVMIGGLLIAMTTGLVFARFARPTARVLFSRVAVVCPFNGVPTLMFRAANQRENRILEAQVKVNLLRNEVSLEGHRLRRFYDLKLLRSQTPAFGLSWLMMHPLDEASALYRATAESLAKLDAEIWVTITGLDETFSQTIHARYSYGIDDIVWFKQFADIFTQTPDGEYTIDLSRFHSIVPLEPFKVEESP